MCLDRFHQLEARPCLYTDLLEGLVVARLDEDVQGKVLLREEPSQVAEPHRVKKLGECRISETCSPICTQFVELRDECINARLEFMVAGAGQLRG